SRPGDRHAAGAEPLADMKDRLVRPRGGRGAIERPLRRGAAVEQARTVRPFDLHAQTVRRHPARDVEDVEGDAAAQLNLTYSKLAGWRLMPCCGGAIQLAYLPGSVTAGPISEVTNRRSSSVGSHLATLAFHSVSPIGLPSGETLSPAKEPMRRLNPRCGSLSSKAMPASAITLFHFSRPLAQSST